MPNLGRRHRTRKGVGTKPTLGTGAGDVAKKGVSEVSSKGRGSSFGRRALTVLLAVGVGAVWTAVVSGTAVAAPPVCVAAGGAPPTGQVKQSDVPPIVIPEAVYTSPVQLQTGHTLAQVFVASCPFDAVAADQPAWGTNGVAGDTLALFQGAGSSGKVIAQHAFTGLNDSWWTVLDLPTSEPAGTYTLKFSNPIKQIGLWAPSAPVTGDYELIDGKAQKPTSNFVIGYYPAAAGASSATSSGSAAASGSGASGTAAASLPKTGSSPLLPITGVGLMVIGAALVFVPRMRTGASR